jgi:hypothetical protein
MGAFESQGFTLKPAAGSTPQTATIGATFAHPLAVTVRANNPVEPVEGGVITFTVNPAAHGASAALSATSAVISGGRASVTAAANCVGGAYTVTASTSGTAPVDFDLVNSYATMARFDQAKRNNSGSTIPIQVEVTDAQGADVGSSSLAVTAVSVVGPLGTVSPTSPGNSQPGDLFKFDPGTGRYQFNLKTTGYAPGKYTLLYTVGDDPTLHSVSFVVG